MAAGAIVNQLDSIPARLNRLRKSFSDLEAQRGLLANCTSAWTELEDYFSEVEATIQSKVDGFLEKKRGFESEMEQEKAALRQREEAISVREKASLARVEEQKDAAIAALAAERSSWIGKHLGDRASAYLLKEPAIAQRESKTKASVQKSTTDVSVRPQLKEFFQKSDCKGLQDYLALDRKDGAAVRKELPVALQKYSPDPLGFVLKVLEFYNVRPTPNQFARSRNACLTMLEALGTTMADPILGETHHISPAIKEGARKIAEKWMKSFHLKADVPNVLPLDAQCFLQLLLTFDLVSEFKEDDLVKLVAIIAARKHAMSICKSLGLSAKVPDLVEKMAKSGKQLEALLFAEAFGIMDKIEPASMLKEYLRLARKAAELALQKAPNAAAGENEAMQRELSSLRTVLKAVEKYKLHSSLPVDNLHMRIEQLEKAREERRKEKRRASLSAKSEEKKPHLHEDKARDDKLPVPLGPRGVAAHDDHRNLPQYGSSAVHRYDRLPELVFDPPAYSAANKRLEMLPSSFERPLDRIGSAYGPSSTYSSLSGLYSGYQYTSALAEPSTYDLRPPSSHQSAYELGPPPSFRSTYELGAAASYQPFNL